MPLFDSFLARHGAQIERVMPIEAAHHVMRSLLVHYYKGDIGFFEDPGRNGDVLANLSNRQAAFEKHLIPWVNCRRPLADATVVDIGCGTGSSTAAFARTAKQVWGYEISPESTAVASARMDALRLRNARVDRVNPAETIGRLHRDFPEGADVVSLIAVMEHMTYQERIEFLPAIWDFLRPGNILVISETPNLLSYFDDHTAKLPFYHLLPLELKARYASQSPRTDFSQGIAELAAKNSPDMETAICRWGVGLSFHDFEVGFGCNDLETILLADGYEYETTNWWPISTEERALISYFLDKPVHKPLGFCRSVLNLIFVKPHPGATGRALKHGVDHVQRLFEWAGLPIAGVQRLLGAD